MEIIAQLTNEYNDKVRQAIERMEKLAEMVNMRVKERYLPLYLTTRPVIDAIRKREMQHWAVTG